MDGAAAFAVAPSLFMRLFQLSRLLPAALCTEILQKSTEAYTLAAYVVNDTAQLQKGGTAYGSNEAFFISVYQSNSSSKPESGYLRAFRRLFLSGFFSWL